MIENIFVDTSGWGCLIDRHQPLHLLTKQIYFETKQQHNQFITTNYIISELVALCMSRLNISRQTSLEFIKNIKSVPHVQVIHVDKLTDELAWQLLLNRTDKDWSLVDCSSFILMQQYKMTKSLTTDHHFEQAGFIRLLK
jgi:predicted nucleic acid-binding protein